MLLKRGDNEAENSHGFFLFFLLKWKSRYHNDEYVENPVTLRLYSAGLDF